MITKILDILKSKKYKDYFSVGALGMYVVAIVALSVAWASTKIIQRNYQLLKQISVLEQEADLAQQKVDNQKLQNEYYKSDAFLELAARRQFNRAAPGEKLMIVPKEVALSKLPPQALEEAQADNSIKEELSNWQYWLRFLTGNFTED